MLTWPSCGRRLIIFIERAGSLGPGLVGVGFAGACGVGRACAVLAAWILAVIRPSNILTIALNLASWLAWEAANFASRRASMVASREASPIYPLGSAFNPFSTGVFAWHLASSSTFLAFKAAICTSIASTRSCTAFTFIKASALYSTLFVVSRSFWVCSPYTAWKPASAS